MSDPKEMKALNLTLHKDADGVYCQAIHYTDGSVRLCGVGRPRHTGPLFSSWAWKRLLREGKVLDR